MTPYYLSLNYQTPVIFESLLYLNFPTQRKIIIFKCQKTSSNDGNDESKISISKILKINAK